MRFDVEKIFIIVFTTFLVSFFITPYIKKLAFHIGSVDKPNNRRVNKVSMPTMGGLAIFLSFILGYMLFCDKMLEMIPILIGGTIIVITGIFDGINPLPPKSKLVGQLLAAFIVVFYGGMVINKIDAFGISINFGYFAYPLTIIFIVGMVNAINLIDGLDGLASGVSAIFFITISVISIILDRFGGLDILLSLIMLGSTLGFLVHNFYPAKIYLGDTGAMFLGYIISIIAILGFKNVTLTSFIVPLLLLWVPVFDTFCAIARRIINKKSISSADKKHLHHQLLNMNYSHKKTVLIIYYINSLFALTSIIYVLKNRVLGIVMYVLLFCIVLWFILKTNILKKEK